MTGGKLRALFLSMLMVGSVFGGTVTLSGAAAANHSTSELTVGNGHYSTVQDAIFDADPGDTIIINSSTRTLNDEILVNVSDLTIRGESPSDRPTIRTDNIGTGGEGFKVRANNVTIKDVILRDDLSAGVAWNIRTKNSGLVVDNVKIVRETTSSGLNNPAINFLDVDSAKVVNSNITRGAINVRANQNADVTITNNSIQGYHEAMFITGPGFDPLPENVNLAVQNNGPLAYATETQDDVFRAYPDINDAINSPDIGDPAASGSTIRIAAGTYSGDITIGNNVTLDGAGEDLTTIQGGSDVINLHSTGVTIRDVSIDGDGGGTGIDVPLTQNASNFNLLNSTIVDTQFGMYVAGDTINGDAEDNGAFDTVEIKNVEVRDTDEKGFYIEKLSNARFENVVVDNVGVPAGPYNNGIDINLKNGTYENIDIVDTVVSNVSMGAPLPDSLSAAIAIKGRDDGGYGSKPGFLDDVLIYNVTVRDSYNGLRFGEPDATTYQPTNITIENSKFADNERYHFQDTRIGLKAPSTNSSTFDGKVVVWNDSSTPAHPDTIWSNIQDGLNNTNPGDKVKVGPGTYDESLTVDTSNIALTSTGDRENTVITSSGTTDVIKLEPDAAGVTIAGFTLRDADRRGIFVGDFGNAPQNTTIANNHIRAIGYSSTDSEVHGVLVEQGANDSVLRDNRIENLSDGVSGRSVGISLVSQDAIGLDSVLVENNTIRDIEADDTADGESKAKGIELSGKVTNAALRNNTVTDIGIGQEGTDEKPRGLAIIEVGEIGPTNFKVTGNTIDDITGDFEESSALEGPVGVFVGGYSDLGDKHELTGNSFLDGIVRRCCGSGSTLNATQNYWGASTGPSEAYGGFGVPVSENVSIEPFYTDEAQTTLSSETSTVEIVVAQDGSGDVETIQSALNVASAGDTIQIKSGTYNGIEIQKPVTLVGDENDRPVIDGGGSNGIEISGADNVTLENLIVNNSNDGLHLDHTAGTSNLHVENVDLRNGTHGLNAPSTTTEDLHTNLSFNGVTASDNEFRGMWFMASVDNVSIEESEFRNNGNAGVDFGIDPGVDIEFSNNSNIHIRDITAEGNEYGVSAHDVTNLTVADSQFANNTETGIHVNGPTGANLQNNSIEGSTTAIKLVEEEFGAPAASGITIEEHVLADNVVHVNDTTDSLDIRSVGQINEIDKGAGINRSGVTVPTIWGSASEAVSAAQDGDNVGIFPGTYDEDLAVSAPNVTVSGAEPGVGLTSPDEVRIDGRIDISSDGVVLQTLTITNSTPDSQDRVDGVLVSLDQDTDEQVVIRDVVVEDLHNQQTGNAVEAIHVFGETATDGVLIEDVTIRNVTQPESGADGIKLQAGISEVEIRNITVQNIHGSWSYGVVTTPSESHPGQPDNVLIEETTFTDITAVDYDGVGVGIDESTSAVAPGDGIEVHNSVFDDLDIGVLNKDPGNITDATSNYWGAANGPSGGVTSPEGNVADGNGVAVSENVTFVPFLSAPGGGPAAATLNTSTLEFGDVPATPDASTDETLAFELTNSGDQPLNLYSLELVGEAPGQFQVVGGDDTGTLDPLETLTVTVAYTPTERAGASANLSIATSAPGQSTVTVELLGTGVGPAATVTAAEPVEFSAEASGSATQETITITNEGDRPLSRVASSSATVPFAVTSDLSGTIAPGESGDVTVEFDPNTGGIHAGLLTVETNDSFSPVTDVRLRGEALAAGAETSIPTSDDIDFGEIVTGSTVSTDVVVTNDGTADLTGITASTGTVDFTASAESSSLAPGESMAVNVSAVPSADGESSDTLTLKSNELSDLTWSLSADAQSPTIDVAGSLDFGDTPVGSTGTDDLTIENTGDLALEVDLSEGIDDSQFSLVGAPDELTVDSGDSRTLTVAFTPEDTGEQDGTLTLGTNDPNTPTATVDVNGSGTESDLSVQGDSTIAFDSIAADATDTASVTIENTGNAPVESLDATVEGDDGQFAVDGVPSTLAPDSTATVDVTYEPGSVGDHSATVTFSGDNGAATSAVLNGTAVPPDVALNRSSADLGFVDVDGGSSTAAVAISNEDTHGTELSVDDLAITGDDAAGFAVASQPDSPIGSGESSAVVVEFTPDSEGEYNATLGIDTNDPDEATRTVDLSGTGTAPEAALSPSPLEFGDVDYGETATRELTVTNDGGVPLEVTGVSADNDQVEITDADTSATLVPGATETYTVAVTPTETSQITATIDVETNANDPSVAVSATPLVAGFSSTPTSGDTITFEDTDTGSATQETLTVTNDGGAPLTLGAPSVSGSDAFSVVNAPATAYVGPGETLSYAIAFSPDAAGEAQATLTFDEISDPEVDSAAFDLEGTGVGADAQFSDASVSLGEVAVGSTGETTLALENEGGASFTVSDVSITGSDAGAFDTDLTSGTTVSGESSTDFTVNVTPTIRNSLSATLEVETEDGETLAASLGATGVGPDIELATTGVDFGEIRLGNSTDRTIQLNNTGNAPLDVTDLTITAGETDQFVAVTDSVVVPPKGSEEVEVRFAPETTPADVDLAHQREAREATLTISSNDTESVEQSLDVDLAGVGVSPSLNVSQQGLQYGTVLVGSTTTRTVTLRNEIAGTAPIEVTSATIQGQDSGAYAIQSDLTGTVLAPGEETSVDVTLNPQSRGSKFATLKLRTNDTRQDTQVVFLSNRETIVRVTYGSVTMDYIDPVDGLQPEVDVYRGRPLPAQMDAFQIATTQDADYSVTLEGGDQAFSNAESSDAFDSIRYLEATTSGSFVGGSEFQNATFTFRVTKAELANRDASQSDVYLYHYDTDSNAYEQLDTEFERETQTEYVYSAETTEFSEFSIGAAQPALSLSNEQVGTTSIDAGESVDVSVDVANDGDAPGEQTVALEVDGTTQSTRTVTVPAGSTETVTFTVTLSQEGTYELGVNGTLAGTVDVSEQSQPPVGGGADGGSSQPSTPAQPVQVLPPEVPQNLVADTLTSAIQGSTVSFEDQDSTVREIAFQDAPTDAGQVTVTELSGVPDGVEDAGDAGNVVHAVDIAVPSELEDSSATVTMTVPVSAIDGADPADATIVHRQDDGTWDAIDTDVVSVQGGEATLEGQTEGFSLFGVAVAQQETPTATPTPTETPEPDATETPTATAEPVQEPGGFDLSTIVLIVLGLVVVIAAVLLGRRRLT